MRRWRGVYQAASVSADGEARLRALKAVDVEQSFCASPGVDRTLLLTGVDAKLWNISLEYCLFRSAAI